MNLEDQNTLIRANLMNMSIQQIDNLLRQFHNYNTLNGAYNEMIGLLEDEKANR
jgi:hypothetical protein